MTTNKKVWTKPSLDVTMIRSAKFFAGKTVSLTKDNTGKTGKLS